MDNYNEKLPASYGNIYLGSRATNKGSFVTPDHKHHWTKSIQISTDCYCSIVPFLTLGIVFGAQKTILTKFRLYLETYRATRRTFPYKCFYFEFEYFPKYTECRLLRTPSPLSTSPPLDS